MDLFTALHTRRSIRRYTDQPVSDQDLRIILDAAMAAPSAGNVQPWEFIVIDDPAILTKVPGINPYAPMATHAPLSVMVCGNLNAEKYKGCWVQDCSAAIQNFLLAAFGLGLGTVWTAVHPMEDRVAAFKQLLNLPEHIIPLGLIVLGYPAVDPERKSRFEAAKVHHNLWGTPKKI